VNRETKVKKNGIVSLLREFWVFSFPLLKAFGWIFPFGIVWRNYFPESYYGSNFTVLGEFSIFVLMPLFFVVLVHEFWKSKNE